MTIQLNAHTVAAMQNLGMVSFKSVFGRYLQSTSSGDMRASNDNRNEEETWFLMEIDKAAHQYAIRNWKHHTYMTKNPNGCCPATSVNVGVHETWIFESSETAGVHGAIAMRSITDTTLVGSMPPGQKMSCSDEVSAEGGGALSGDANWAGWWLMEAASEPTPGRDPFNTIGNAVGGVINALGGPEVVAGVLASLLL